MNDYDSPMFWEYTAMLNNMNRVLEQIIVPTMKIPVPDPGTVVDRALRGMVQLEQAKAA